MNFTYYSILCASIVHIQYNIDCFTQKYLRSTQKSYINFMRPHTRRATVAKKTLVPTYYLTKMLLFFLSYSKGFFFEAYLTLDVIKSVIFKYLEQSLDIIMMRCKSGRSKLTGRRFEPMTGQMTYVVSCASIIIMCVVCVSRPPIHISNPIGAVA